MVLKRLRLFLPQIPEKAFRRALSITGLILQLPLCWSLPCRIKVNGASLYRKAFAMTNSSPIFPSLWIRPGEKWSTLCLEGQTDVVWPTGEVNLVSKRLKVGEDSTLPTDHTKPQAPGGTLLVLLPAIPLWLAAYWYSKAWTNMIGMSSPPLSLFLLKRSFCSSGII